MTDEPGRPLAEAYAAWTALRGVTVAAVQRASGVQRHTIENVRDGGRRHPSQATLRRIAIGIIRATSGSLRYDATAMTECFRDLSLAAGYGDPTAADARSLLDLALYYHFRSPSRARIWAHLIGRYGAVSEERLSEVFAALGPGDDAATTSEEQ